MTTTIPQIVKDCRTHMDKAIESSKREFSSIRSGKASPSMLDTVRVEMYGTQMTLNQVASVSAPEPRIILVTPFDKGQLKAVEKAIRESDLGLDPAVQGGVIRVPLPMMNEQRRKELAKVVHKLAEEGRIAVRHARTTARDQLKKLNGVSEDDVKHAEKDLQKVHDDYITKIDQMIKAKEAEIMEV
jgi:ribosome recycling factor